MASAREINLGLCPEPEIAFPDSEFRARHQRIRERMAAEGLDVLYLTAPESRYYVGRLQLRLVSRPRVRPTGTPPAGLRFMWTTTRSLPLSVRSMWCS